MYKFEIKENCPLCGHLANNFYQDIFYKCDNCFGIFRARKFLLSPEDEKKRYENHNNDVNDKGYRQFVSPIVNAITKNFTNESLGLDFGSGTGPVISEILKEKAYLIKQYDPFFQNDIGVLKLKYDYIVSCEVIEHFYNPEREFKLFKKLLKPNGHLYCMTLIYDDNFDFKNWYYKNDETHCFFYQNETLLWIKNKFRFSILSVNERLIEFIN